tara:strand:- start:375 stop:1139 length:765 start_codon:yes stop_codon:yes gene_type:complete
MKLFIFNLICLLLLSCGKDRKSDTEVPGREETTKTDVLEIGASALQKKGPFDHMNIYLVGFHPMKEDPSHQMEAHHFCTQINEDFAQCALFDGNTEDAKLTGIEYIISEKLFNTLSKQERKYWHPHNYEILSGQLVAPGLPDVANKELMESKMNSYGKTWHVWSTGNSEGDGDKIPLGDPQLAWSFNRDGEAKPGLVENRDKEMDINSREKREERKDLTPQAKPQEGVDFLKGKFSRETKSLPGVESKNDPDNQ